MTPPTEPLAPLTDAELVAWKNKPEVSDPRAAARVILRLIASEESHRRVAGTFEQVVREWLGPERVITGYGTEQDAVRSLASLLSSVHRAAMGRAAGIAEQAKCGLSAYDRACQDITTAIRRAAAEQGDGK